LARYNPTTRSGFNMFDMASMLQKAVRRGDTERAGLAAYELYGSYQSMMWKRILTISAEDCWGVLTKELVHLRKMDEMLNAGKTGYHKDPKYVSMAIALLCKAKKSRDACYFACNFILAENPRHEIECSAEEVERVRSTVDVIPGEAFSLDVMRSPRLIEELFSPLVEEQAGLFATARPAANRKKFAETTPDGSDPYLVASVLVKAVSYRDMENIGYASGQLRSFHRDILWRTLLATNILFCSGRLTSEIVGLKLTDDMVNGRKKPEERDEIFIAKALMNICYDLSDDFGSVEAYQAVHLYELIEWSKYKIGSVADCKLPDGIIPEWVYDVHTIRGKKAGKTDWGMNLVEQEALNPLQIAFFDEGSWAPRYDYKHEHNMCSQLEYDLSLEYRKDHDANPTPQFIEERRVEDNSHGNFKETFAFLSSRYLGV